MKPTLTLAICGIVVLAFAVAQDPPPLPEALPPYTVIGATGMVHRSSVPQMPVPPVEPARLFRSLDRPQGEPFLQTNGFPCSVTHTDIKILGVVTNFGPIKMRIFIRVSYRGDIQDLEIAYIPKP